MSPEDDDDTSIHRRFAALSPASKTAPADEDALAARFHQLFSRAPSSSSALDDSDDALHAGDSWDVDDGEIGAVLAEAAAAAAAVAGVHKDDEAEEQELLERVRLEVEWEARHGIREEA